MRYPLRAPSKLVCLGGALLNASFADDALRGHSERLELLVRRRSVSTNAQSRWILQGKGYFLPGWYSPGIQRNVIASRFHPLMVMIASVRFTSSSSEKLFLAFSYTGSGT